MIYYLLLAYIVFRVSVVLIVMMKSSIRTSLHLVSKNLKILLAIMTIKHLALLQALSRNFLLKVSDAKSSSILVSQNNYTHQSCETFPPTNMVGLKVIPNYMVLKYYCQVKVEHTGGKKYNIRHQFFPVLSDNFYTISSFNQLHFQKYSISIAS